MRIHSDFFDEAIAPLPVGIREPVKQRVLFQAFGLVEQVTPLLVAERFTIRDQKLQVARVRRIHMRKIDLVDDAVAEREPDAGTAVVRGAETVLGAGSPARLDAWRPEGDGFLIHQVHIVGG